MPRHHHEARPFERAHERVGAAPTAADAAPEQPQRLRHIGEHFSEERRLGEVLLLEGQWPPLGQPPPPRGAPSDLLDGAPWEEDSAAV